MTSDQIKTKQKSCIFLGITLCLSNIEHENFMKTLEISLLLLNTYL